MKIYLLFKSFQHHKWPEHAVELDNHFTGIGALCIAAAIEKAFPDIETECIETYEETNQEELLEKISDATHIGFSLYSWNLSFFKSIAQIIKQRNPQVVLFAGGAEVIHNLENCKQLNLFDVLVYGEGELAIVKIVDQWLHNEIPDPVVDIPIHDLSTLPSPWTTKFWNPKSAYQEWELTRGCIFRCSYCGYRKHNGIEVDRVSGVRRFSWERINDELDVFIQKGINEITIQDCAFNYNLKWAMRLLDLFIEKAPNIEFHFEMKPELLNEEILCKIGKIKNPLIAYGVQSIHPHVLRNVNRAVVPKEKYIEIERLCKKYHIRTQADLIFGLPGDTLEGFFESIDFVASLEPTNLQVTQLMLTSFIDLYNERDIWGIKSIEGYPYWTIRTNTMSEEDFRMARKVSYAVPVLYQNKEADSGPTIVSHLKILGIRPSTFFQKLSEHVRAIDEMNIDLISPIAEDLTPGAYKIAQKIVEEEYIKQLGNYND